MEEVRQESKPLADSFATPAQVAAKLGISDDTVYRLIRDGDIKAIDCTPSSPLRQGVVAHPVAVGG